MSDSKPELEVYPERHAEQVLDRIVTQGIFQMSGEQIHPRNRVASDLEEKIRESGPQKSTAFYDAVRLVLERNCSVVIDVGESLCKEYWKISPPEPLASNGERYLIAENISRHHSYQAQKAEFISGIAHEVRTPLTSLLMGIHLLKQGLNENSAVDGVATSRWLELCSQEGERLRGLVEQLLSSARLSLLDPDSFAGSKIPLSPLDIYSAALNSARNEAEVRNVTLLPLERDLKNLYPLRDHSVHPASMLGDPVRLGWAFEQTLLRLIRSGRKGDRIASSLVRQESECLAGCGVRIELRVGQLGGEDSESDLDWHEGIVLPQDDPDPSHFGITLARDALRSMGASLTWIRRPVSAESDRLFDGFWIAWNEPGPAAFKLAATPNQKMGN